MTFIFLKIIVLEEYEKITLHFFSFFFVYLSSTLINENSHKRILAFDERPIELILIGKICLYCFDSVFSQILSEFLFVGNICCSFCNCKEN